MDQIITTETNLSAQELGQRRTSEDSFASDFALWLAEVDPEATREGIAAETRFQLQRFAGVAVLNKSHLEAAIRNYRERNPRKLFERDLGDNPHVLGKAFSDERILAERENAAPAAPVAKSDPAMIWPEDLAPRTTT